MSIKIELKNLGILKQAEFSLGDLTVICGKNNTGKTYIAYMTDNSQIQSGRSRPKKKDTHCMTKFPTIIMV